MKSKFMSKLTPMMLQYREIKEKYKDCMLLFRLGDFYEMFCEDAQEASKILQIALTSRAGNKMCGIPFHALNNYAYKLTKAGKKIAICEQLSKPDGKGIVKREVVRVITPGTTFDENILEGKENNFVGAVFEKSSVFALSYCDITTGEFKVAQFDSLNDLLSEVRRLEIKEIIGDEKKYSGLFLNENFFHYEISESPDFVLKDFFKINSLSIFGLEEKPSAIASCALLLSYLKETQKSDLKHLHKIKFSENSVFMILNEQCFSNLELFYSSLGKKEGSLNFVIDQCETFMGSRLLKKWMTFPLVDKIEIEDRLSKVSVFFKDSSLLRNIRDLFSELYDIERLLSKLTLNTGNARDLIAMKISLLRVPKIKELISPINEFSEYFERLDPLFDLCELIDRAILEEPSASLNDGGIINEGYNAELDDLRAICFEGKDFIKKIQEREIARSKINSLKVKYNKVFGYYIEISKSNLSSVPDDYIRKQTLSNAERFITPELKEYEAKVLNAEEKIKEKEYELFYEVRMALTNEIKKIQKNAEIIAHLDVFSNFAHLALKNNYCKPVIVENNDLSIKNGRHPVLEVFGDNFVPNDCELNDKQNFILITGPNMGGKSTFLRQVALIVYMAQIGCFVPAEKACLGIFDRIFTRVGAFDNLLKGESTFMVEMQEASHILNFATNKSLIILDEIGRGTSTYDGVSIAWAISEYIHDFIGAKTLFATHYHELVELVEKLKKAANFSAAVSEKDSGLVFLYKIISGGTDKSYGIEVAKLAGFPEEIISRAYDVLRDLEEKTIKSGNISSNQLELFQNQKKHKSIRESDNKISKDFKELDLDNMTPLEALKKLSEIKNRFMAQ